MLEKMVGSQMRVPPAYSAVKYKGKRSTSMRGRAKRSLFLHDPSEIYQMKLIDSGPDWLRVEIHCREERTRGSLPMTLQGLGTVGHLSELRRLQSGPFVLEEAVDMPGLAQIVAGRDDFQEVFSKPVSG